MICITTPKFSVYDYGYIGKNGKPTPNPRPFNAATLTEMYQYITGGYAKNETEALRNIVSHDEAQQYKALHFRTMSPAGLFRYRNAKSLIKHSGLMVIDIDGIASHKRLMQIREQLLNDKVFQTQLLFISPSGNGLKWIIYVADMEGNSHSSFFNKVRIYLSNVYGIEADKSGSDVCRICYLPHDPSCYINPELLD